MLVIWFTLQGKDIKKCHGWGEFYCIKNVLVYSHNITQPLGCIRWNQVSRKHTFPFDYESFCLWGALRSCIVKLLTSTYDLLEFFFLPQPLSLERDHYLVELLNNVISIEWFNNIMFSIRSVGNLGSPMSRTWSLP